MKASRWVDLSLKSGRPRLTPSYEVVQKEQRIVIPECFYRESCTKSKNKIPAFAGMTTFWTT